ncbi:MAG TPA: alanine--glyoxylate aminotransferase family protein [Armatimonadota bacterium]
MSEPIHPLFVPQRLLLGPGPSQVHPRVLQAMSTPLVGHLDPVFLHIMDEVSGMLRQVFRTGNRLTLPISGTGSAGMEAAIANMVEPGDPVIVGVNGVFGQRLAETVRRCGGEAVEVSAEWGQPLNPSEVRQALSSVTRPKALVVVHAETSTGVLQPLEELSQMAHSWGALFIADTVTSLGGTPVEVDRWEIDVAYSGTQKCLSCPPGLAPITLSDRAVEALHARRAKVQSWYLDLSMIERYWGEERVYHHTAPISMCYAIHEALRLVLEEGLEARWARHRAMSDLLLGGLESLGVLPLPDEGYRLPMLNAVRVPEGVNEAAVRSTLLNEFGIEIGAGLGPLKGKVWRIGLMGESATRASVVRLLDGLMQAMAGVD